MKGKEGKGGRRAERRANKGMWQERGNKDNMGGEEGGGEGVERKEKGRVG